MPDSLFIEDLKKAEQQLKEDEGSKNFPIPKRSPSFTISRAISENKKAVFQTTSQKPGDWISPGIWQEEILNEKQRLEETRKKIENWQRKIQERLAIIKELEDQSEKINRAVEQLQQKMVLVKKGNSTVLYQIKDNIERGNRSRDFKKDSGE